MNQDANIIWPGWDVVETIGSGGFGVVYKIRRFILDMEEIAAVKVISIPKEENNIQEMLNEGYNEESITEIYKDHLQSIISEYTMMKKLSECDNIVKCDDIRSVQHDNGIGWDVYIKMELLTPLVDALPDKITEDTTIKLAKDICNALVVCDKNNVLHRDIKPQNIFVATNGCYKLGDFGISKIAQKTSYGTHVGTPKYMAPEVYNNQPYGVSADIYSLGLVMYWMLNQRRMPFLPATGKISMAMDEQAKARRLSGERIPAPANGSNSLKKIVLKACAYNPEDRYKTPQQMLDDLNNIGKKPESKPILDIYKTVQLTELEAKLGCTKTVQSENGKAYSVTVPVNAKNGDILRLMGAGKTDPITGIKGVMYVTLNILNPAPKPPEPKAIVIGEVAIESYEVNKDCTKEATLFSGQKKTIKIRGGCKNGSIIDGVKIYVHDMKSSTAGMESLPDAVLKMYSERSLDIGIWVLISFCVCLFIGGILMQPLIFAIGWSLCIIWSVISGVRKAITREKAKKILVQRRLSKTQ